MSEEIKNPFPPSRIEEILVGITIGMSCPESRERMWQEYHYYSKKGYQVDNYNLNTPKKIVMTKGDKVFEVVE